MTLDDEDDYYDPDYDPDSAYNDGGPSQPVTRRSLLAFLGLAAFAPVLIKAARVLPAPMERMVHEAAAYQPTETNLFDVFVSDGGEGTYNCALIKRIDRLLHPEDLTDGLLPMRPSPALVDSYCEQYEGMSAERFDELIARTERDFGFFPVRREQIRMGSMVRWYAAPGDELYKRPLLAA